MNLIKIAPLFFLALAIDGFQLLVSLALSVVAAVPGTALGAAGGTAAGAYLCQGFGSVIIAGCSATGGVILGLFGTWFDGAAVITEPIGVALGFAVSVCISFTLGSVLVLFLQLFGVLDKKAALMAYMGEVLPGVSVLPAWTALVVRCGMKEVRKEVFNGAVNTVLGVSGALPLSTTGTVPQTGVVARRKVATPAEPQDNEKVERTASLQRSLPMQDMRLRPRQTDTDHALQSYVKAA